MIVPMMKSVVVCLKSEQEQALEKLREFGLMHVQISENVEKSAKSLELENSMLNGKRIIAAFSNFDHIEFKTDKSKEEIFAECVKLLDRNVEITKELEQHYRDRDHLLPWGNFDAEMLASFKERGLYVYLCCGGDDEQEEMAERGIVEFIHDDGSNSFFALICQAEQNAEELPLVAVPKRRLSDVELEIEKLSVEHDDNEKMLACYASVQHEVKDYLSEIAEDLEFHVNNDAMIEAGELVYLEGYVPKKEVNNLKQYANEHGWALDISEPKISDPKVPTYLKTPKIFKIAEPIFDFMGVSPGYRENDISIFLVIFMTIFFAMIIGDAGYGLIFLIAGIIAKVMIKDEKAKLPINLILTFGVATMVWGALSGSYFCITETLLPKFLLYPRKLMEIVPPWISGVDADRLRAALGGNDISDAILSEIRQKNTQYLCFVLAVIHLSGARLWRFYLELGRSIRLALGYLGYAIFLWGNFFLVVNIIAYSGSFPAWGTWLMVAGLVLMIFGLCKDDIMNFPFAIIGCFVDSLSYIRLFAVGLSGFYVANNFNAIGGQLCEIHWTLIVAGVLVILFGHILNILLALMSVLVHGLRLNILEFSNHMGLEWSGIAYKPFKKQK